MQNNYNKTKQNKTNQNFDNTHANNNGTKDFSYFLFFLLFCEKKRQPDHTMHKQATCDQTLT